jgi:hypothetical protein
MQPHIDRLRRLYPELRFTPAKQFYWSPETQEIFYNSAASGRQALWSLLHESGHALLGHSSYQADVELLRLEMEAWERAKQLAVGLDVTIDEDHIQDCLDTYRDWLYKRSICPACGTKCLQQGDFVHYRCFNCHTVWKVSGDRFRRSYRSTKAISKIIAATSL